MAKQTEQRSLEERLAEHPEVLERIRRIAEELERELGKMGGLDEVEDRVVEMIRQLGLKVLQGQAGRMATVSARHPQARAVKHAKKVRWLTPPRGGGGRRAGLAGEGPLPAPLLRAGRRGVPGRLPPAQLSFRPARKTPRRPQIDRRSPRSRPSASTETLRRLVAPRNASPSHALHRTHQRLFRLLLENYSPSESPTRSAPHKAPRTSAGFAPVGCALEIPQRLPYFPLKPLIIAAFRLPRPPPGPCWRNRLASPR